MKKILILGSKGMAGHIIKEYLKEKNYDVYSTFRSKTNQILLDKEFDLDIFNIEKLNLLLQIIKPDFVINCIGILNKEAEENPDIAIYVNGYIPHLLDRLSNKYNYKLIHITTDCVFSGIKGNYTEIDFKDAVSYYGKSKAIGEIENNKTLTFRTSIVGPDINKEGIGLFNWFMAQSGKINGYSQVYWTGITTLELAKAIEKSFKMNPTGLINLVNNDKINKYNLLKLFKENMEKNDIEIIKENSYKSDKSLLRTKFDFKYTVPSYEEMIKEMAVWIKEHDFLYNY